jgi:hypothetical protein
MTVERLPACVAARPGVASADKTATASSAGHSDPIRRIDCKHGREWGAGLSVPEAYPTANEFNLSLADDPVVEPRRIGAGWDKQDNERALL